MILSAFATRWASINLKTTFIKKVGLTGARGVNRANFGISIGDYRSEHLDCF